MQKDSPGACTGPELRPTKAQGHPPKQGPRPEDVAWDMLYVARPEESLLRPARQ